MVEIENPQSALATMLLRTGIYKVATSLLGVTSAVLLLVGWLTANNFTIIKDQPMPLSLSAYWGLLGVMVAICGGFLTLLANSVELSEKIRLLENRQGECEDESHHRIPCTE